MFLICFMAYFNYYKLSLWMFLVFLAISIMLTNKCYRIDVEDTDDNNK